MVGILEAKLLSSNTAFTVVEISLSTEICTISGKKGDILQLNLLPDFLCLFIALTIMLLDASADYISASLGIDDMYTSIEFKPAVFHVISRFDYMLVSFNSHKKA